MTAPTTSERAPYDWRPLVYSLGVAFLASCPPTIASIGALVVALRNSSAVEGVKSDVAVVHTAVNSTQEKNVTALRIMSEDNAVLRVQIEELQNGLRTALPRTVPAR